MGEEVLYAADQCGRRSSKVATGLFTSKIFCKIKILAVSFVFDKYCPIID